MSDEETTEYKKLREELFALRYQLQNAKDEQRQKNIKIRITDVKHQIAKLLLKDSEEKKKGK